VRPNFRYTPNVPDIPAETLQLTDFWPCVTSLASLLNGIAPTPLLLQARLILSPSLAVSHELSAVLGSPRYVAGILFPPLDAFPAFIDYASLDQVAEFPLGTRLLDEGTFQSEEQVPAIAGLLTDIIAG
jgi:hypothetical protein